MKSKFDKRDYMPIPAIPLRRVAKVIGEGEEKLQSKL